MSKPFSIKTEPWASFDKQSYQIFTDDFVHQKLLTAKVNVKSKGTFNYKKKITKKGDAYKTQGEIKLWFPVWNSRNGHLYFLSKNNQMKLHYDDGLKDLSKGLFEQYNLYGSYQSQHQFKNIVLKAGANLIAKNLILDNRVRVALQDSGQYEVSTGHKLAYTKDNWSIASYQVFNFKSKALINNALRIGYRQNDNQVFFRAQNQTSRSFNGFNFVGLDSYFKIFTLDYIRKVDDQTKVAVQGTFTKSSIGKSSFLLQRNIPNKDLNIKLKVSTDKSVALSAQSVLKDYGKWTVGFEASDLGKTNKLRYGVQLDLNL